MSTSDRDSRPQETTSRTVVALFRQRASAEAAVRDLRDAGFSSDAIGVAMQDVDEGNEAAKGAVGGGVLGGVLGALGSLLVPGLGPLMVGGILGSALAGAGLGAATGGILGALTSIGVSEEDARHFDSGLRAGGTLVTVAAGIKTPEALAIFERHRAELGGPRGEDQADVDASASDHSIPGAAAPSSYAGVERRVFADPSYPGPERRLAVA
jgi:hypothetical protein